MTSEDDIPNIILDEGGSNEITLYTARVKRNRTKMIQKIVSPQSTANWSLGPKDTKLIDLLRIELRFTINCHINSADIAKFDNLIEGGGVFNMKWNGTTYTVNSEKDEINWGNGTQDEKPLTFTVLVGVDI